MKINTWPNAIRKVWGCLITGVHLLREGSFEEWTLPEYLGKQLSRNTAGITY